jgi:hypothetical protein
VVHRFICPRAECQQVSIVVQPSEKARGPVVSAG